MSKAYGLLIFDWDGTLMDSAERIVRCFQAAARDCGWPVLTDDAIRRTIGLGVAEALARLLPGEAPARHQALASRYREHFLRLNDTPTPLFPGVAEGLSDLRARGYRIAVATGKSRVGLEAALDASGTRAVFCATRCADETRSKPDPLMLHEILAQTGVGASDALMVGDTSYDIEMATRAGMDSVGVGYGVHDLAELRLHGARLCVGNFPELCAWLP
ncbi:HAD-IA family hydrolase [Acidiferrobacter sp.]|uniref:HAD-IA family hydrolase n=1 Tax=Acidiferrobacter sp. TaxID=1872107 RepID=UPI0026290611|nr:HAD-IA family hydrolase [Acidiferrobacter sp.]